MTNANGLALHFVVEFIVHTITIFQIFQLQWSCFPLLYLSSLTAVHILVYDNVECVLTASVVLFFLNVLHAFHKRLTNYESHLFTLIFLITKTEVKCVSYTYFNNALDVICMLLVL